MSKKFSLVVKRHTNGIVSSVTSPDCHGTATVLRPKQSLRQTDLKQATECNSTGGTRMIDIRKMTDMINAVVRLHMTKIKIPLVRSP